MSALAPERLHALRWVIGRGVDERTDRESRFCTPADTWTAFLQTRDGNLLPSQEFKNILIVRDALFKVDIA